MISAIRSETGCSSLCYSFSTETRWVIEMAEDECKIAQNVVHEAVCAGSGLEGMGRPGVVSGDGGVPPELNFLLSYDVLTEGGRSRDWLRGRITYMYE